jgi:hypothetical protein
MKWFAGDERDWPEVFRVFSVELQFSPEPAQNPTIMSQNKSTLPFSRIFSSSGGATDTMSSFVSFPETRRATSRPELSGNI